MWEIGSHQLLYSFPLSLGHRWELAFDFGGKMGNKFAIFNGPEVPTFFTTSYRIQLKMWDIEAPEAQVLVQLKAS